MNSSSFSGKTGPSADEHARLAALYQYGLLDTAPEAAFDRLVEIVALHFDAPVALVSFIDDHRQWFKAKVGCDVSEAPRSESMCSTTIQGDGVMVVPDATLDPRFQDFPSVRAGVVRFYAGVPLVTSDGYSIGTLCVNAPEQRIFTTKDRRVLEAFAAMVMDEVKLRQAVVDLGRMALNDNLTGLPNRVYFRQQLTVALRRAGLNDQHVVVGLLDLNGFKGINDTLGHAAGDDLLRLSAARLRETLGSSDVVARMGGDEFALVLGDFRNLADVDVVMRRLQQAFTAPFVLEGREVLVQWSVGLSVYPDDGTEEEALLRHADSAMYRVKRGGGGYGFFSEAHDRRASEGTEVLTALHRAVMEEELFLQYQPIVRASDQVVVSHEALLRWTRQGGVAMPASFMPVADSSGLIVPIGRWVLEEAARAVQLGLLDRVAVNVSAREFAHPSFLRNVEETLARTGLDPARLTLEIKEGSLLDFVRAPEVLGALRALGIRLALDDFGLGLTSLTVLSALPIDVLKLDRSFIARVGDGKEDGERAARLVRSVVQLAGSLGFGTVAEGVETRLQAQLLTNAGCTHLQGYLFGRPGALGEVLPGESKLVSALS
ncbi:EAL domain-containing protein (plasmid) [Deinococcus radiomollis]|uniref:putative bifunctional diguanylate cyclase/phosphodiesterase n=1 Tax=Deinococcus radiomollis TaxID=468916 RepID=UPI003892001A